MAIISKIINWLFLIYMALHGVIRKYVNPIIYFIEGIKLLMAMNEEELSKETMHETLKKRLGKYHSALLRLLNAFVEAAMTVLPDEVLKDLDRRKIYDVIRITVLHFKTIDNKLVLSVTIIQFATVMFFDLYGKKVRTNEVHFIIQSTYSYLKYKGRI